MSIAAKCTCGKSIPFCIGGRGCENPPTANPLTNKTPKDMKETIEPKPVKERDNIDLLELVCQLHSRALMYSANQKMHEAYVEARTELESRLSQPSEQS